MLESLLSQASAIRHIDTAASNSARYNRALSLWQNGDFERCLRLLDQIPFDRHISDSILLRARALLRVNRISEAKAWLTLNITRHTHEDAIGTNAMLMGTASAQLNEHAAAGKWFDVVSELSCHHTIVTETHYFRAMALYLAGDFDGAFKLGRLALRPSEDIVYARTRSLFGWIAVAGSNYLSAYTQFIASLDVLERCRGKDTHLRANTVCALAIASAEAELGEPQLLDAETAKVAWTASLERQHVQTLRHIGFAYEARGDVTLAMRRFAAAAEVAPGTAWAILGYSACANLAWRLGQVESAEAFAHLAMSLKSRIEESVGWQAIEDEQRFALLELAYTAALLGDGERAAACRDLYYQNTELAALSSLRHDLRLATYKQHIDAVVAAALGSPLEATEALTEVAENWHRIGCSRRAAEAEKDLARIAASPESRVSTAAAFVGPIQELSRREHAIVQLVAAGLSNAEIAVRLNVAPKTVKNRIGQIYKKYGVHDRTKLALRSKGQDVTFQSRAATT